MARTLRGASTKSLLREDFTKLWVSSLRPVEQFGAVADRVHEGVQFLCGLFGITAREALWPMGIAWKGLGITWYPTLEKLPGTETGQVFLK